MQPFPEGSFYSILFHFTLFYSILDYIDGFSLLSSADADIVDAPAHSAPLFFSCILLSTDKGKFKYDTFLGGIFYFSFF